MRALDAWSALPLTAALAAIVLIALRVRVVAFQAALDGPRYARALAAHLEAGRVDAARSLATQLRPAWAAELTLEVLNSPPAAHERGLALEEALARLELAAQAGLLAIRSLGRIALPLSLAIAIVELGRGFAPAAERVLAVGQAFTSGSFAVSVGLAVSLACQIGYGLIAREAKQRLHELRSASEVLRAHA